MTTCGGDDGDLSPTEATDGFVGNTSEPPPPTPTTPAPESTETTPASARRPKSRKRPSQKGKPRLRLVKHVTKRAIAAAAEKAARRERRAAEKAARREKAIVARKERKKRKAAAVERRPAARRKLDIDGERRPTPPKRVERPSCTRSDLIENLRCLTVLDLAGELVEESPVTPPPASPEIEIPPAIYDRATLIKNLITLAESQNLPSTAAATSTAIVAFAPNYDGGGGQMIIIQKKTKKATRVDKLVLVQQRQRATTAAADEDIAGKAMVVYGGPTMMTPRTYMPRWVTEMVVLDRMPARSGCLVLGIDAATKAVYNELMLREETAFGDEELDDDDVPGGPEWDERRREFRVKVDHFMENVKSIIGDREFSEWGGSVVNSVVGTFLTQNVKDGASSDAFMRVVAKFPQKKIRAQNSDVPLLLTDGQDEQWHCRMPSSIPCRGSSESGVAEPGDASKLEQRNCPDKDLQALISSLGNSEISKWDEDDIKQVLIARFGNVSNRNFEKSTAGKIFKDIKSIKATDTSIWKALFEEACKNGYKKDDSLEDIDMVDWEALMNAPFSDFENCIRDRGQHSQMAIRILAFLFRIKRDHGSIDLEWLRFVPRAKATKYLLSIKGLGPKSVGCIRLLSLRHNAFPVDTNVARIVTRLGWVQLQPLPNSQEFHLVDNYPNMAGIQTYLDPLMCNIPAPTKYELHCHMITFGKIICSKAKPNCSACPFSSDCKYYRSQFVRAARALPEFSQQDAPNEAGMDTEKIYDLISKASSEEMHQYQIENGQSTERHWSEPIIVIPPTPPPEYPTSDEEDENPHHYVDMEDIGLDIDMEDMMQDYDMEIDLRPMKPTANSSQIVPTHGEEMISFNPHAQSTRKQKKYSLRTEYIGYIVPDGHSVLHKFEPRVPGDRNPYLLVIRSFDDQNAKATILIPCRTANNGMFPLNGTYFQENEVFADHSSSRLPIQISWDIVQSFYRCKVYFGTSIHSVTKGQTREELHDFYNEGLQSAILDITLNNREQNMLLNAFIHSNL